MGEFNAGVWIVSLSLYFVILFLIVNASLNMALEYGIDDDDISAEDTGFFSADGTGAGSYQNVTIDSGSTANMNTFFESIKFLTGLGGTSIQLGEPSQFSWIFRFILFYIPLLMLIWSVYMALPIIH